MQKLSLAVLASLVFAAGCSSPAQLMVPPTAVGAGSDSTGSPMLQPSPSPATAATPTDATFPCPVWSAGTNLQIKVFGPDGDISQSVERVHVVSQDDRVPFDTSAILVGDSFIATNVPLRLPVLVTVLGRDGSSQAKSIVIDPPLDRCGVPVGPSFVVSFGPPSTTEDYDTH